MEKCKGTTWEEKRVAHVSPLLAKVSEGKHQRHQEGVCRKETRAKGELTLGPIQLTEGGDSRTSLKFSNKWA